MRHDASFIRRTILRARNPPLPYSARCAATMLHTLASHIQHFAENLVSYPSTIVVNVTGSHALSSPSPLLCFMAAHERLFREEILDKRMCPHSRAMLARAGNACRMAVESSGLPRAGRHCLDGPKLNVMAYFLTSVKLLRWAQRNGATFLMSDSRTISHVSVQNQTKACCAAARSGHLEVLEYLAVPSNLLLHLAGPYASITAAATGGGQLEILLWLENIAVEMTVETIAAACELGNLDARTSPGGKQQCHQIQHLRR